MYNVGDIVIIKSGEWFSHQCDCGKAYFDAQPFTYVQILWKKV